MEEIKQQEEQIEIEIEIEKEDNNNNLIWEKCSYCYISARNGNKDSFNELKSLAYHPYITTITSNTNTPTTITTTTTITPTPTNTTTNTNNNNYKLEINHIICLSYFMLVMKRCEEFYNEEIFQEIIELINQKIKKLTSNNLLILTNLTNKYEQFIFGILCEEGIGIETNLEQAFQLYQLSANQGFVLAESMLGYCYGQGIGVEKNQELALEYYIKAAEKNFSVALYNLGLYYEIGRGVEKNLTKAIQCYEASAKEGYINAQNSLGRCYEYGIGVKQDYSKFFDWYKKSADRGNPDGQYVVGWSYYYGKGVEKNEEESIIWFQKSASQGNLAAQYYLGSYYIRSNNILKHDEGYQLIKKSAEGGYLESEYALGLQYFTGERVQVDEQEAIKWFQLSVDHGSWRGSFILGKYLHSGTIKEKNIKESIRLLDNASIEGSTSLKYTLGLYSLQDKDDILNQIKGYEQMIKLHSNPNTPYYDVMYILGFCHEYGIGTNIDINESYTFYSDSCMYDYAPAQYSLGRYYEEGVYFETDLEEAKRLYTLAADQGDIDAINRLREYPEDNIRIKMNSNKRKYEFKEI